LAAEYADGDMVCLGKGTVRVVLDSDVADLVFLGIHRISAFLQTLSVWRHYEQFDISVCGLSARLHYKLPGVLSLMLSEILELDQRIQVGHQEVLDKSPVESEGTHFHRVRY